MKTFRGGIALGLGDLIVIKTQFDAIKTEYSEIELSFNKNLYQHSLHTNDAGWVHRRQLWDKYLDDISKLFFSEPPYKISQMAYPYWSTDQILDRLQMTPRKPELAHLLAKGTSLQLDAPYLVLHTKCRHVNKHILFPNSIHLWRMLKQLSQKYYIVILGEKIVEMRKEYEGIKHEVFSMYEHMIVNLPPDRVIDLTVPALGETVSDITQIQRDCLIMKEAVASITFGIGGNFCLSTAVSNLAIGFRTEHYWITDAVFNQEYPNAFITHDWNKFMQKLGAL